MITITSTSNPEIKRIVKLHDAKERRKQGQFLIEGLRAISTAVHAGMTCLGLFAVKETVSLAQELCPTLSIIEVSDAIMKKISTTMSPSGLLAVFALPSAPDPTKLTAGLVLAAISDPGNMGTLIRTAAACGITSVVIIEGADPWSPKVVQASAGTIATLDIFEWSWQTLLANKKKMGLCALVAKGDQSLLKMNMSNALLVVGNEAHGIPVLWQSDCQYLLTLPMPGNVESLNAAIAGSIALYITHVAKNLCNGA